MYVKGAGEILLFSFREHWSTGLASVPQDMLLTRCNLRKDTSNKSPPRVVMGVTMGTPNF